MICISINQESRRLVLVDMLNAAKQCDLLEIRLDRFGKAPDIGELIANKPKPLIMTCRREQDGGYWDGTEDERLAILRQCIISKTDYVEIELDVADDIRKFPPAQRVISYTNLRETPNDILDIYEEAKTKSPDVIKLTTLARTPEEAWPLVQILAKPVVPTVVVGLGKPGVMLSVLGKKIGAPWTYAALERGMEAYPGQPTVSDLNDIYHYGSINKSTRLIGVTGFGDRQKAAVSVLNAILAHHQLPGRCLPLGVGNVRVFRKIMDAVKLAGVIVDPAHQHDLRVIAREMQEDAEKAGAVDTLLNKGDIWKGYNFGIAAIVQAVTRKLHAKFQSENPLKDRVVMIVGLTPMGQALAGELQRHGAGVSLCSHQKKAGQAMAQEVGNCRFIQFEAFYSTGHDVLIVCDEEKTESSGRGAGGIHFGYLKPGMTVLDLTAELLPTTLLKGAADRGCLVIDPKELLLAQLDLQARKITRKETPHELLEKAVPEFLLEAAEDQ